MVFILILLLVDHHGGLLLQVEHVVGVWEQVRGVYKGGGRNTQIYYKLSIDIQP